MKILIMNKDSKYTYCRYYLENQCIGVRLNRETKRCSFCVEDVCKVLNLDESVERFIQTDQGLDIINEWRKKHPDHNILFLKAIRARLRGKKWMEL